MYQCKMVKLFLGILQELKIFLEIYLTVFLTQFLTQNCAYRLCRSTGRSTDVHRPVHVWWHSGPVDQSADRIREPCSLYLGGRPSGRLEQKVCSLYLGGRPGGRPYCPNGHISDRWRSAGPADRRPVRLTDQPNS